MDNQQESLRLERKLGYLAGIIDGEGTITLRFHSRKDKTPIIQPAVTIVNTDIKIINACANTLKELGLPFWLTEYEGKGNWKKRYLIEISGLKRVPKILSVITDYLVGKKELAEIVNEYCERRLNLLGRHWYYTEEDLEYVRRVKSFHGHQDKVKITLETIAKSSETICGTQDKNPVKI